MSDILVEHLQILGSGFILALLFSGLAYRLGFYSLKKRWFATPFLSLRDVLGIFFVFLSIELILMPLCFFLYISIKEGHFVHLAKIHLDPITQGWFNIVGIFATCSGIILYLLFSSKRQLILWAEPDKEKKIRRGIRSFFLGSLTWILSYPYVLIAGQLIAIFLYFVIPPIHIDQIAVKQLKMTVNDPSLFITTALVIVFIIPPAEEILFRGFLQRWFVEQLGMLKGITLSSLLFALFHFASSQGWDNIELVASLFILACFLGFLYERQGTLWAPIGLHMTFNAISVGLITWGEFVK